VNVVEILQADEAPEPLAAFRHFEVGIEGVEGLAVRGREPYPVVLDLEILDVGQGIAAHLHLSVTLNPDNDFSVLSACAFNGLDRIHHHLDNRRIYGRIGPYVLDCALDVDFTHEFPAALQYIRQGWCRARRHIPSV
jgi:hypothetical protein